MKTFICWLVGHKFTMEEKGKHLYRFCFRCGYTSVLAEKLTLGVVTGEKWKEVEEP